MKDSIAHKEYSYTVVYDRLAEGGYQVIVPALPGLVTFGRNREEAREMARDAIVCHVNGLLKDGEEIPRESPDREPLVTERMSVTV